MNNIRIIPRLDIKGKNLIKGICLEGLRVIGNPTQHAIKYYNDGADELIFMDAVASLYGRNMLTELINEIARDVFIPITVGGGIRTIQDARHILRSGADKIAINTAAISNPELISEVAYKFGSQSMVVSVEAKSISHNRWEVYTDNGRERTGMDVVEWVQRAVSLGAGEVLLTSVDREGTRRGFDLDLIQQVSSSVSVPVIASGGMGKPDDFISAVLQGKADAVSMADVLHYKRLTIHDIRNECLSKGLLVRSFKS
ncbi:MAG: imidazole glycerol phosphate synthase subunit HisF [Methylococcaceae bacterium]